MFRWAPGRIQCTVLILIHCRFIQNSEEVKMDRSSRPTVKQTGCEALGHARPEEHIQVSVCMCWWNPGFSKKKKKKVQSWNVEVVVQMEGGAGGGWTEERLGPSIRFCGRSYRCSEMSVRFLLTHPGLSRWCLFCFHVHGDSNNQRHHLRGGQTWSMSIE